MSEENNSFNELNESLYEETNNNHITNEDIYDSKVETNEDLELVENNRKKKSIILLSSFTLLCALFVVVQAGLYVPVFSEIFKKPKKTIVTTTKVIETTTNSSDTTKLPVGYAFSSISSTDDSISMSLTLSNANVVDDEYYIYLVESGKDSNEYLSSIPLSIKNNARIRVNSSNISNTFTKYITQTGEELLKPNKDYVILLVLNDQIVKKETIKTQKLVYIFNITSEKIPDVTERYLKLKVEVNAKFTNYTYLLVKLYNVTLNKFEDEYHSLISKENITTSFPLFTFKQDRPEYTYRIYVYCLSDNLSEIEYTDTTIKDEIIYYLIYIHDEDVNY